jgi:hypothetical protein
LDLTDNESAAEPSTETSIAPIERPGFAVAAAVTA